jgi:hypothetical protein
MPPSHAVPRNDRFILYVLKTSPTPDRCEGAVPWRIDADEIFFGPCKKRLRRALRDRFLGPDRQLRILSDRERIVIAGVNAGQGRTPRKIVWAGELRMVMSFAEAAARLDGDRYRQMREVRATPLHVVPTWEDGRLVGYTHRGLEHAEESRNHPGEFSWWDDLVPRPMRGTRVALADRSMVQLADGCSWWDGFPLDACMTLTNLFWADGAGLPLDERAVALLRAAQPGADAVDASAPFGRNGLGHADGKRGSYLEVEGAVASQLCDWIASERKTSPAPLEPASLPRAPRRC